MAEVKVICNCGQKYKFDVEPVRGQMPFAVNCPTCGLDGTHLANAQLALLPPPSLAAMPPIGVVVPSASTPPPIPTPPPVPVPAAAAVPAPAPPGGLQIKRPATVVSTAATVFVAPPPAPSVPMATGRPSPPRSVGPAPAIPKYLQTNAAIQNNSFAMGIVGALAAALVGVGLIVGFALLTGFRLPLTGTLIGALIGLGARLGYRGTDSTLGGMAAVVALISIGGTIFFLFGIAGLLFGIITLVVGVGMAFKIASG